MAARTVRCLLRLGDDDPWKPWADLIAVLLFVLVFGAPIWFTIAVFVGRLW